MTTDRSRTAAAGERHALMSQGGTPDTSTQDEVPAGQAEVQGEAAMGVETDGANAFWIQLSGEKDPRGGDINLGWIGIPNTDPNAAAAFVAVWQGNGSIPWGSDALATQAVSDTSPDGGLDFTGLHLGNLPYVVGYSTGPDATNFNNIAVALPIGVGGTVGDPQPTTVMLANLKPTTLTVDYTTPIGTMPATQNHSVVLVEGASFYPTRSKAIAVASPPDVQNSSVVFNETFQTGQAYTVAYLTGQMKDPNNPKNMVPDPKTVAATLEFTVPN
jgi:hypothetical protein